MGHADRLRSAEAEGTLWLDLRSDILIWRRFPRFGILGSDDPTMEHADGLRSAEAEGTLYLSLCSGVLT
jgi:hypothetical protein